jgi:hypothetical protein
MALFLTTWIHRSSYQLNPVVDSDLPQQYNLPVDVQTVIIYWGIIVCK